jgi:predicted ATPase
MAVAIPRHYKLLDDAICQNSGVRPVEQGEGDSVVGAFSRASDAVAAAVAAQRAFLKEPWPKESRLQVRMALHTGETQPREDGTYVGETLNRCARIRALGHGGQILVSAATAALVADRRPAGAYLVDLGIHRLKDLARPEHIWQVSHADLPAEFPALRSMDAFRYSLPIQLTPLIGRGSEIAELARLVASERLVTLTGSAGVGKTRLAAALAAEVVERYPGGVWWTELAAVADGGSIGRAVLAVLGAREEPEVATARQLAEELGEQATLIVLDNCEHLLASCAALVAELLLTNGSVSVLTTTREPLGVPGEATWRVPSLAFPQSEREVGVATLSQYDAVRLFLDRAVRARQAFRVSDENAPAIAQICRRLDGIPLAIELAAARCRHMSAERLAADLDDRFRLLTGGARTVMPRQQTLLASVEWSYERLDHAERITFRRIGVFAGPFPLGAAEAVVAAAGDVEVPDVFTLISQLVDKSLVIAEDSDEEEPHYRLLETLRAYALDQTGVAGELDLLRHAHATWWAHWLDSRGDTPTDEILQQVDEFHDNLKAALDWSVKDPEVGLRLLRHLARFWSEFGRVAEAIEAADRLLTDENAALYGAAWLPAAIGSAWLWSQGTQKSICLLERVEKVAMRLGDDYHAALARWIPTLEPAQCIFIRTLARKRGDRYIEAYATVELANQLAEDSPREAASALLEADAVAGPGGSYVREYAVLAHAIAARSNGDLVQCVELIRGALARSRNPNVTAINPLSFAALLTRDEGSLRLAVEIGDRVRRTFPGAAPWAETARHRLRLLEGEPSGIQAVDLDDKWPITNASLWLAAREAIDAGAKDIALAGVRALGRPVAHSRAVAACVTAAATRSEEKWHTALLIAIDHDLRLVAVDALEGLATAAVGAESWVETLRLVGAAQRLRDETGYRWRFAFEEASLADACTAAQSALGSAANVLLSDEQLEWHEAAAYARRSQGSTFRIRNRRNRTAPHRGSMT